ncbi:Unknown protein, partial [Striga hermonthica]
KSCRYHRLTFAAMKKSQSTTTDRAMMVNRRFPFKDAMSEPQYTGRLRRESSPPAFRSENRQQPEEDDHQFQSFVLRSCLSKWNTFFQKSVHFQSAVFYSSLNCELIKSFI